MKKAILTFGLFSLVVLTSFTTTEIKTQNMVAETGDTGGDSSTKKDMGGQSTNPTSNKKIDNPVTNTSRLNSKTEYSNNSSFSFETRKKSDI
ncbi:hypothetical protein [Flavobacterium microcysteis]|uniref:Uncharacterized protein n=1 Tax=Flavobacterium microcysteis TaxID=2596891 RepID=A0A501PXZ0_9FLAO|nr:hypothetical protein [Flavobacterium microcysteis]TPD65293.1 hypothetical protein FJA49_13905 [Flavobacterium microcysteis]